MSRQQEQELNQLRLHYSKQRSMEYLLDKLGSEDCQRDAGDGGKSPPEAELY